MDTGDRSRRSRQGSASCWESKKDDCGLALRFCPASCFGCREEASKGEDSRYDAIIYRNGEWGIEQ